MIHLVAQHSGLLLHAAAPGVGRRGDRGMTAAAMGHGRWVHGLLVFTYIHCVSFVRRPTNLVNAESQILLTLALAT